MRRLFLCFATASWLALSLAQPAGAASPWASTTFVQLASPDPAALGSTTDDAGGAKAAAPTEESKNYTLLDKKVRWQPGPTVEYRIVGAPFAAAADAVVRSEETLDRYITTRDFRRNDATTQINPCTGQPSTVRWAPIDGPGGAVGQTTLCIDVGARAIVGFEMTLDSADGWSIGADGNPATYDVQNVATHEWGHVAGLDHVTRRQASCRRVTWSRPAT